MKIICNVLGIAVIGVGIYIWVIFDYPDVSVFSFGSGLSYLYQLYQRGLHYTIIMFLNTILAFTTASLGWKVYNWKSHEDEGSAQRKQKMFQIAKRVILIMAIVIIGNLCTLLRYYNYIR